LATLAYSARRIHISKPSDGKEYGQVIYSFLLTTKPNTDLTTDKLPSPINDVLSRKVEADMIGTPDPVSNLRPVRYFTPSDETPEVRKIGRLYHNALMLN